MEKQKGGLIRLVCLSLMALGLVLSSCLVKELEVNYTVTFNANGGSGIVPAAQTVNDGESITLPSGSGLSRTGYTFDGWNTSADGTETNYSAGSSYTVTDDITLYAKWITVVITANYTVTFNANGGSGTVPAVQTVNDGESITLPSGSGLSRSGYTFGGWNTSDDGTGTNYNAGSSYTVTGEVILYAKWDVITQAVSPDRFEYYWVDQHGSLVTTSGGTTSIANGATLTITAQGTGYVVQQWRLNGKDTGHSENTYNFSSTTAGNHTVSLLVEKEGRLYNTNIAITVLPYTVTFDVNGGSGTPPSAQTIAVGSSITLPSGSGLSRTGYNFGGWNTNPSGTGTTYNPGASYTPAGNITLYARWTLLEMVYVPGGSFQMGDTAGGGHIDQRPVHTVTLTDFYIGKYEVTQAQYQAVMGSLPSSLTSGSFGKGNNYPVYYVSWYDALVFCNKLSMMEGLTPAYRISGSTDPTVWGTVPTNSNSTWNAVEIVSGSTGYRLPTEAQWEYAAKGGNGSPGNYTYSGSNNVGNVAWYYDNSNRITHLVGTKSPNGLGIYDMSGNVGEWCWDWYGDYSSDAQTNPLGASSGSGRVERGGYWGLPADNVSSVRRISNTPNDRYYGLGIRLVRP
jgi:uncharacterized repeat protein (TIGR02543 family)